MRTGRPKQPLILTEEEQDRLQSLAHQARSQPLLARRARLVLACAEGLDNKTVARKVRASLGMVGKWRSRFLKARLEGLYDEPRPGAPRKVSDARVEQVVIQTLESTPRGDALEHTRFGESHRAQPDDDQPNLARLRLATSSHRHFQAVARLSTDRESARHCGPLYEPAGSRPGVLRGREEPDSGARPHATAAAFTAGATRAPHPRLQTPWDNFPVCGAGIEDQSSDRPTPPSPSRRGISPVLGSDRGAGARRTGGAYHRR